MQIVVIYNSRKRFLFSKMYLKTQIKKKNKLFVKQNVFKNVMANIKIRLVCFFAWITNWTKWLKRETKKKKIHQIHLCAKMHNVLSITRIVKCIVLWITADKCLPEIYVGAREPRCKTLMIQRSSPRSRKNVWTVWLRRGGNTNSGATISSKASRRAIGNRYLWKQTISHRSASPIGASAVVFFRQKRAKNSIFTQHQTYKYLNRARGFGTKTKRTYLRAFLFSATRVSQYGHFIFHFTDSDFHTRKMIPNNRGTMTVTEQFFLEFIVFLEAWIDSVRLFRSHHRLFFIYFVTHRGVTL